MEMKTIEMYSTIPITPLKVYHTVKDIKIRL